MPALRTALLKLAHQQPETRKDLLPLLRRIAMEFPSARALKLYLKKHPKANKRLHTVKKEETAPYAGPDPKKVLAQASKLKTYKHLRDYTEDELEQETGEYFENEYTSSIAPKAFKSPKELAKTIKDTKPRPLTNAEYVQLGAQGNTDAPFVMASKNPKGKARQLAESYGRDFDRVEKGFTEGHKMPPPIILRDKNKNLYLMAGNTRMMGSVALGHRLPAKVIDYKGAFDFEAGKQFL